MVVVFTWDHCSGYGMNDNVGLSDQDSEIKAQQPLSPHPLNELAGPDDELS